jgi:D-glycero-beta-D-manno-heptose-7-phosphate kinase
MDYTAVFASFAQKNVLIIGDVMLDAYLWGKVDRISPEAPVPIVSVHKRENRMGGAANVALNIQSLGANPILCSVIGDDDKAAEFLARMELKQMDSCGIIRSADRITTTKFRIIGNNMQMLRVDEENEKDLSKKEEDSLIEKISSILEEKHIDAIILEDYDKGCLTAKLINYVIETAERKNIIVTADPKKKNFKLYNNISLFKPNLKELCEGVGVDCQEKNLEEIRLAAEDYFKTTNNQILMLTLSNRGVLIFSKEKQKISSYHVAAVERDISDVSGAGDTVISVATLCLTVNLGAQEIARISNLAGGLVCEKTGVVPINKELLLDEVEKKQ